MKLGGQVWAFILSGAHTKDGLYLLWACGHGLIGLAKPYLTFYPLHTACKEFYLKFSLFFIEQVINISLLAWFMFSIISLILNVWTLDLVVG